MCFNFDQVRVMMQEGESEGEDDGDDDGNFFPSSVDDELHEDFFPSPKFKMENVDFSWMDKYTHVAQGGKSLKGTNFLPAQELFNELTKAEGVLPCIPLGKKEDVYFIVDNSRNLKYRHRRNYFQVKENFNITFFAW